MTQHNLLGKFIFLERTDHAGDGYYQSGEITGQATSQIYLVKLDKGEGPQVSVLIDANEMLGEFCFIFETREAMAEWVEWLELDEDKVVKLKKVEIN